MRTACDLLTATLAGALVWACLYAAPVPPPRRPAPPAAPLERWELAGAWEVRHKGAARWWVTLCPTGAYRASARQDAHDRGEGSYHGTWRLEGGKLSVREWPAGAAPGSEGVGYEAPAARSGRDLAVSGPTWMAGEWRRR